MPIYEYECNACGECHEFIQKFSEGPKRKCPSCGKSRLKKLMSAAAFHLKGSGWYVTDFRDKDGSKKKDGDAADATAESGSETKSDATSDAKSDSKSESGSGKSESGSGKSESKDDAKSKNKDGSKKSSTKKTKAA